MKVIRDKMEQPGELEATVQSLQMKLRKCEEARRQAEESLTDMKGMNGCLPRINPICAEQVCALFPLVRASR